MKLTKYVHACVLVEDDQHTTLFDPGEFSWASGLFNVDNLNKLDRIIITHEHSDHYSLPFVEALVKKFPNAKITTTENLVKILNDKGIINTDSKSDELVDVEFLAHQSMEPLAPPPCQNIRVHYKGKISHPGDSHQLTDTKDILFVPLAGPWGATIDGVRMADKLKPKVIVPIHDWMWNEEWKQDMYDRIESFFAEQGIKFIKAIDGQSFEV